MKTRKQTILAVAAAIGLSGGIHNFAQAQAQGQGKHAPAGQRGGDGDAGPSRGGTGGGGGNSAPPSRSDDSSNDRAGNDGGAERRNERSGARSPSRTAPNSTPPARTPAPQSRAPAQASPNDASGRPAHNTLPPTRVPRGTVRERVAERPNAPAARLAERRRQRQQQISEQMAQRPIILSPTWYRADTWPWWYETYFPALGFYGNGIDDYSGWDDDTGGAVTGGWHDDRYDERRDDRRTTDSASNSATTSPPPAVTPAAGQGAAALNADPAYRQALAEVARLQARYDEASRKVLEKLKEDDAQYRQLLQLRDRAEDRVDAAQARSEATAGADPAKVAPAAQRKLEINTRITQWEQESIRRDSEASEARKALEEANARVAAMRQAAGPTAPTTPAAAPTLVPR